MSIRTNGSEWKDFCRSRLEGYVVANLMITADNMQKFDSTLVKDDTVLTITGGTIRDRQGIKSLEPVFRCWRKNKGCLRMVIEFNRENEISIRECVEKAGGRVIG